MGIRCGTRSLHLKNSIFERYDIPSDDIKLVLTGTGTITGKVVDKDGKRPAGGIVLELEPEGGNKPGTWEPNIGKVKIEGGKNYEIEVLHEDIKNRVPNIIRKFLEKRFNNER